MKINDELFWLIGSMSRNEKGYFKKFSERHKRNSKFVLLFDAIEKQTQRANPVYDEEQIKKRFTNERFVNNLRMAKSYLHSLVLQSLCMFHNDNDADAEMNNILLQLKVLYDKELYEQCHKLIEKGLKISETIERFPHTILFLKWKERIFRSEVFMNTSPEMIESLFSKMNTAVEKEKNLMTYLNSSALIAFSSNKKGLLRVDRKFVNVSKNNTELYESEKNALSSRALFHYYNYHISVYMTAYDFKKAKQYAEKMVHLLESPGGKSIGSVLLYLNALERLFNSKSRLKEYDGMETIVNKMSKIEGKTKRINAEVFFKSQIYRLNLCTLTGEVSSVETLLSTILKNKIPTITPLDKRNAIILDYYIAYINILLGKFSDANKRLNSINNQASYGIRDDYFSWARIVSIIVSYEMGKDDLLEYAVKSTYRYLLKRQTLHKVEEAVLSFIRKDLNKAVSKQQQLTAFKKLKNRLVEITADPFEAHALTYFNMIAWLESKISNIPFRVAIQKNSIK